MNRNPASHFSSSLNVTVVLCICVGWSTVETRDALQMWAIPLPGCRLFYCNWAGACVCARKINTSTLATNKSLQTIWRSKGIFLFVTDNYSICLLREAVNCGALWISGNMVSALCCWQKELLLCILLRCRSTGKEMKGGGLWWSQKKKSQHTYKLKWLNRW